MQRATIEHNAVAATAIAKYIEDQVDNVKKTLKFQTYMKWGNWSVQHPRKKAYKLLHKSRRDLDMNMKLVSFCEDEERLYLQSSYLHIYICMMASHVFCLPFWPPNWSFSYIGSHSHISSLVQKRRYFVMSTIKQTEIATVHDRKREWCSFLRLY